MTTEDSADEGAAMAASPEDLAALALVDRRGRAAARALDAALASADIANGRGSTAGGDERAPVDRTPLEIDLAAADAATSRAGLVPG
jgi:hypothetical protein